jgi:2-amino-4-hydroxy-6-hydroxymethyldihydropteridine diphosphokinase
MMHIVYILLGGNQGEPIKNFNIAKSELELKAGEIIQESSLYLTAAWGFADQPDFINQVIVLKTRIGAAELLDVCLNAETLVGRVRTVKNAPRLIDLDILFYDADVIHEPQLQIPHPRIPDRRFVLVPLCELSPQLHHPILGKTMSELLEECSDSLDVKKI